MTWKVRSKIFLPISNMYTWVNNLHESSRNYDITSTIRFYLWLNKASANERKRYVCNVFSHWPIPCSVGIDRKGALFRTCSLCRTACFGRQWFRSDCAVCMARTQPYCAHTHVWWDVWRCIHCPVNIPESKVHGTHLGPTGPRWAPCWPHELCYLGYFWKPSQVSSVNIIYLRLGHALEITSITFCGMWFLIHISNWWRYN